MKKLALLLSLSILSSACGASIVGMVPVAGGSTVAAEQGTATIIFVRHSRLGGRISFPIVTEDGQFVANLRGRMHAIVPVPAGHHRFFVLAENAELAEVEAVPGNTYVVEARPRMGWGKARVTVEGVLRNTERFAEAPEWIRGTPAFVPDQTSGSAWAAEHRESVMEKIAGALADWAAADDAYRAARTLGAQDGYTPQEGGL